MPDALSDAEKLALLKDRLEAVMEELQETCKELNLIGHHVALTGWDQTSVNQRVVMDLQGGESYTILNREEWLKGVSV